MTWIFAAKTLLKVATQLWCNSYGTNTFAFVFFAGLAFSIHGGTEVRDPLNRYVLRLGNRCTTVFKAPSYEVAPSNFVRGSRAPLPGVRWTSAFEDKEIWVLLTWSRVTESVWPTWQCQFSAVCAQFRPVKNSLYQREFPVKCPLFARFVCCVPLDSVSSFLPWWMPRRTREGTSSFVSLWACNWLSQCVQSGSPTEPMPYLTALSGDGIAVFKPVQLLWMICQGLGGSQSRLDQCWTTFKPSWIRTLPSPCLHWPNKLEFPTAPPTKQWQRLWEWRSDQPVGCLTFWQCHNKPVDSRLPGTFWGLSGGTPVAQENDNRRWKLVSCLWSWQSLPKSPVDQTWGPEAQDAQERTLDDQGDDDCLFWLSRCHPDGICPRRSRNHGSTLSGHNEKVKECHQKEKTSPLAPQLMDSPPRWGPRPSRPESENIFWEHCNKAPTPSYLLTWFSSGGLLVVWED